MALTKTKPKELGFKAPDFSLLDPKDNESKTLNLLMGKRGTIVAFICNHCPYVKHVIEEINNIAIDYKERGINLIAINSNDIENYPEDHPDKMVEWANALGFQFPYLFDENQEVAKAYDAVCTPEFSLFDEELKCVYRGRLDAASPGNKAPVNGADLRAAIDSLLSGNKEIPNQIPSMGCNIKWK
ncbi:thioredoxin family protein [Luteibaculum oceani]|uniref:Thioredoxin family protein n=1 Tax=Luteibaculum oceani TaxID=1294296 RepID=A0A5C6UX59_9FLAO|nr:thioredoxin family protein [Luteibaculum oceani]TXC75578.1 thioredoxin family protein [Luteibaculum oceani]